MTQSQMQAPLLVSSDVASEAVDSSAAVDLQMVPTAVLMGDGSEAAQDAQEQHAELGPERDPADPQEWATGVLDCCATPYSRVWYGLSCPCCLYADISLHMNRRQDADDADCEWCGHCLLYQVLKYLELPLQSLLVLAVPPAAFAWGICPPNPFTAGLVARMRSAIRVRHNLAQEPCNIYCSPFLCLGNDCCAAWWCQGCTLIQLANQLDAEDIKRESAATASEEGTLSASPSLRNNMLAYSRVKDPRPLVCLKEFAWCMGFPWESAEIERERSIRKEVCCAVGSRKL